MATWSLIQGRQYCTVWHMQEKRCINMLKHCVDYHRTHIKAYVNL